MAGLYHSPDEFGFEDGNSINPSSSGLKESPCLICKHHKEGLPPDECRYFKDCLLGALPKPLEEPKPTRTCEFPGCKNKLSKFNPKAKYCWEGGHSKLVSNRKCRHPNNPELWLLPPGHGGRGNDLKDRIYEEL